MAEPPVDIFVFTPLTAVSNLIRYAVTDYSNKPTCLKIASAGSLYLSDHRPRPRDIDRVRLGLMVLKYSTRASYQKRIAEAVRRAGGAAAQVGIMLPGVTAENYPLDEYQFEPHYYVLDTVDVLRQFLSRILRPHDNVYMPLADPLIRAIEMVQRCRPLEPPGLVDAGKKRASSDVVLTLTEQEARQVKQRADEPTKAEEGAADDTVCVVCMENVRTHMTVYCNHFCYCSACVVQLRERGVCYVCNQPFKDIWVVHT